MRNAAFADTIDLVVSDVSGQKRVKASSVPRSSTIDEMVHELLVKLGLRRDDADGHAVSWRLRLDREARHLNGDELVGDALAPDDLVTLHPSADAGAAERTR